MEGALPRLARCREAACPKGIAHNKFVGNNIPQNVNLLTKTRCREKLHSATLARRDSGKPVRTRAGSPIPYTLFKKGTTTATVRFDLKYRTRGKSDSHRRFVPEGVTIPANSVRFDLIN